MRIADFPPIDRVEVREVVTDDDVGRKLLDAEPTAIAALRPLRTRASWYLEPAFA